MRPSPRLFVALTGFVCVVLVLASCTTVNRLDRHRIQGATISANLRVPPEPKFDVHYVVRFDSRNPVGTALSIGSNIAMAAEASRAESRMRDALYSINIPDIVLGESYSACASALDARKVYRKYDADYLLDLEIREYGIRADSPRGAVSMVMRLSARLYHNRSGELVWRRDVSVDNRAAPHMFGIGNVFGNVVTASVLADLSTREIADGFERLAVESSKSLARKLERDLYSVRYRE